MGDGSIVHMTEAEIREDMKAGMEDAVSREKFHHSQTKSSSISMKSSQCRAYRGVEPGNKCHYKRLRLDKINTKCGIPTDRAINAMLHENFGATS